MINFKSSYHNLEHPSRVLTLVFICLFCSQYSFSKDRKKLSAQAIARKSYHSIVQITSMDKSGKPLSFGTGFFAASNKVVTNFHVIDGASIVTIKVLVNQQEYNVVAVDGHSIENDLAVLRVNGNEKYLSFTEILPNIGDTIYVNGNPEGLIGTFSSGIVSAIRRSTEKTMIQITAPISPGSSGSPVMNVYGEVIGVASSGMVNGQNLNFAIPLTAGIHTTTVSLADLPTSRIRPISQEQPNQPVRAGNFKYNNQGTPASFSIINDTHDKIMLSGYKIYWYNKNMNYVHSETQLWIQTIEPKSAWDYPRFPRVKKELLDGAAYFSIEEIQYQPIR